MVNLPRLSLLTALCTVWKQKVDVTTVAKEGLIQIIFFAENASQKIQSWISECVLGPYAVCTTLIIILQFSFASPDLYTTLYLISKPPILLHSICLCLNNGEELRNSGWVPIILGIETLQWQSPRQSSGWQSAQTVGNWEVEVLASCTVGPPWASECHRSPQQTLIKMPDQ